MARAPPKRRNETDSNRERHRHLLADEGIRSWYDARALSSQLSADSDVRKLGLILQRLGLGPSEVVEVARDDPTRLKRLLVQYATALASKERRAAYIAKTFSGLKSWLEFNDVEFDKFPKLKVVRGTTLTKERVPSPEELRRILGALSPRGRVVFLMMAHAGVRPQTLGSYQADTGLRLENLEDLDLRGEITFRRVPFRIQIPAELSKTGKAYVTFGSAELADSVLAYLKGRKIGEEKILRPTSPLVAVAPQAHQHAFRETKGIGGFITTKAVVFEVRSALKKIVPPGVTWRPYVGRAYFSTRMWLAESNGRITRAQREAMMGHDGIDATYNLSKPLHPELIEEMRTAYQRAAEYLESGAGADRLLGMERLLRLNLVAARVPKEEVDRLDLSTLTEEEMDQLLEKAQAASRGSSGRKGTGASTGDAVPLAPTSSARSDRRQDVFPIGEAKRLIQAGYEYVAPLGAEEVVLRLPASPNHTRS